jgi:hypothetical protein
MEFFYASRFSTRRILCVIRKVHQVLPSMLARRFAHANQLFAIAVWVLVCHDMRFGGAYQAFSMRLLWHDANQLTSHR